MTQAKLLLSTSLLALGLAVATPSMAQVEGVEFSGFVSTSFMYNFNRPDSDITTGRSFDIDHADFTLNKLKLEVQKPVDFSADKWEVGFRGDLIFGQDAALLQSAGLDLGSDGDVEQLFVTVNVPVGNGLKISAGKQVTLMGLEVIEETLNPNWSVGNQFLFVENFAGTGIEFNYRWSDVIDTQFRIFNGWDVVDDNNNALSFMGRIGITVDEATSIGVVGYAGPEQADNTSAWRTGINVVASRQLTPDLTIWLQGDYGHEEASDALPIPTQSAEWWAVGFWAAYNISETVGVAFRADHLDDKDGARTSSAPFTAPFPDNTGHKLTSLTLTLNLLPIENLQIRPELRWDHSDEDFFEGRNGLFEKSNQTSVAIGVAYSF